MKLLVTFSIFITNKKRWTIFLIRGDRALESWGWGLEIGQPFKACKTGDYLYGDEYWQGV